MDMKFREAQLDKVIRRFGFEHEATITFARLVEDKTVSDETLEMLADMEPVADEED
jgi:hypothetical protein